MYGQNQTSEAWTYSPRSFEGLLIFLFEVLGILCERVGRLTFKEVASTCGEHEKTYNRRMQGILVVLCHAITGH